MKKTEKSETTKTKSSSAPRKKSTRASRAKSPDSGSKPIPFESVGAPAANHDEIARLAYLIYRQRIAEGVRGDAVSDWLAAEEEILSEANVAALA